MCLIPYPVYIREGEEPEPPHFPDENYYLTKIAAIVTLVLFIIILLAHVIVAWMNGRWSWEIFWIVTPLFVGPSLFGTVVFACFKL